jgi:hypothetical protein
MPDAPRYALEDDESTWDDCRVRGPVNYEGVDQTGSDATRRVPVAGVGDSVITAGGWKTPGLSACPAPSCRLWSPLVSVRRLLYGSA